MTEVVGKKVMNNPLARTSGEAIFIKSAKKGPLDSHAHVGQATQLAEIMPPKPRPVTNYAKKRQRNNALEGTSNPTGKSSSRIQTFNTMDGVDGHKSHGTVNVSKILRNRGKISSQSPSGSRNTLHHKIVLSQG